MNRSIFSLFIAFLIFPVASAFAQGDSGVVKGTKSREWLDNVKDYKYEMLEREVQMTPEQVERFFPLYQEMEKKVFEANLEARRLEMQLSENFDTATDSDFRKAAQALSNVKVLEAEIEKEYFAQFDDILSDKQLFLLKRAETHFATDMLRHYNHSKVRNQ